MRMKKVVEHGIYGAERGSNTDEERMGNREFVFLLCRSVVLRFQYISLFILWLGST